jgi:hypothetical protein
VTAATVVLVAGRRSRRLARGGVVVVVGLLLLTLLVLPLLLGAPTQVSCRSLALPPGAGPALSASQEANAQVIAAEGVRAGVGLRGVVVALAAALQESKLQDLPYGDRDSLGLFQQRPSAGWGTPAQIMNPALAAAAFYGIATHSSNPGLVDVPGWQAMSVGAAAQAVQRSAFPDAYSQWEGQATQVATRLLGGSTAGVAGVPVSATTSTYRLGPVQPQATYVANLIGPMFHISTVGGWRPSDAIDPAGHPAGLALDFMIPGGPAGNGTGDALAAYVQEHAAELDVKYVIWHQRIWSPARAAEGWRLMPDRGSPTANHMDHVHVSLNGTAGGTAVAGCSGGGSTGGWYAGTSGDPNAMDNATIVGTWSDTSAAVQTDLSSLQRLSGWTGAVDIAVGGTVLGSGESYAAAAAGAYDARWRSAARALAAQREHASGPTFVRPWHEFNGDWYQQWQVTRATVGQYKAAFRRWAGIVRSIMPSAYITWSPNDTSHLDVNGAQAYPGDDVVDVIGVDSYDFHPPGSGVAEVTAALERGSPTAPQAPETWRKFAELHGKPIALPEWGLCPVSAGCGGDHPAYITAMHTWMDAHANTTAWAVGQPIPAAAAGRVLYSIYFDVVHGGDRGYTLAANPRSAAVFAALSWGN